MSKDEIIKNAQEIYRKYNYYKPLLADLDNKMKEIDELLKDPGYTRFIPRNRVDPFLSIVKEFVATTAEYIDMSGKTSKMILDNAKEFEQEDTTGEKEKIKELFLRRTVNVTDPKVLGVKTAGFVKNYPRYRVDIQLWAEDLRKRIYGEPNPDKEMIPEKSNQPEDKIEEVKKI